MTYKSSSDILVSYGRIIKRNKTHNDIISYPDPRRRKMAAWLVSNTKVNGQELNRDKIVEELSKYIKVQSGIVEYA